MKVLYIECNMGIAGDMLMSALWDLVDDKEKQLNIIHTMGLPYTTISFDKIESCQISGYHARVLVDGEEEGSNPSHHHHIHRKLADVNAIIASLNVNDNVKDKAKEIYALIADAESKVHGEPVSVVHFHEVGMLDAIADVVVCSYLIDLLEIDKIIASPVNVGSGSVKCAHGILPVPAPATAQILNHIPYYKSDIKCELCTPTGAAILKSFASGFGEMPIIEVTGIGYGFGSKEFEQANCVRAFLGSCDKAALVSELVCNVDDMTAEELGFASEMLLANGALDVCVESVCMKKSRPGYIIRIMCSSDETNKFIRLIFDYTSSIGIRENVCSRYVLNRTIKTVSTPYGDIQVKYSDGFGVHKAKIEFDDVSRLAKENDLSFRQMNECLKAYI